MKINNLYEFVYKSPIISIVILFIIGSTITGSCGLIFKSMQNGPPIMNCRKECFDIDDKRDECIKKCFEANENIVKIWKQKQEISDDLRNR